MPGGSSGSTSFYRSNRASKFDCASTTNARVCEGIVFNQAKPGTYVFEQLILEWKTSDAENKLALDINNACDIPPGKLVYLGTFDSELNSKEGGGLFAPEQVKYNIRILQDDSDVSTALQTFRNRYPLLYERFKDNVEKASWQR